MPATTTTTTTAARNDSNWVPACGGTETPFTTRNVFRVLYLFDTTTGEHAYLHLRRDMILTTDEAMAALGV
jgi:hypothetical protein